MTKRISNISLCFFFLVGVLACISQSLAEKKGEGPVIYLDKTSHTFPPVFEGVELSHTFTVFNRGTANLDLKKVTHS